MARTYPIRLFPDPVLRKPSRPSNWRDPEIQSFIGDLTATLYAQPGGIGIAAPQVGVSEQIIIVDVSTKNPEGRRLVMINPTILRLEGEILSREGCMSLPDYTANVKRGRRILIEWTDERGQNHRKTAEGIEAICLQHELDHLAGHLFIDRVTSLKTEIYTRKRRLRKEP